MPTRFVQWFCIAVLFVAFVLWQWMADYEFSLRVAACSGAAVVAVQAFHFPFVNRLGLVAMVLVAATFAVSLTELKSLEFGS